MNRSVVSGPVLSSDEKDKASDCRTCVYCRPVDFSMLPALCTGFGMGQPCEEMIHPVTGAREPVFMIAARSMEIVSTSPYPLAQAVNSDRCCPRYVRLKGIWPRLARALCIG